MDKELIEIELSKHVQDYLKHITTLSTGSIVLMATLWEKMSTNAELLGSITVAIVGFQASIIGAILVMTIRVMHFSGRS